MTREVFKSSCELKQIINQYFDDINKISIIEKYGEISEWDVSNITNMNEMFNNCYEFNSDLSK